MMSSNLGYRAISPGFATRSSAGPANLLGTDLITSRGFVPPDSQHVRIDSVRQSSPQSNRPPLQFADLSFSDRHTVRDTPRLELQMAESSNDGRGSFSVPSRGSVSERSATGGRNSIASPTGHRTSV